MTTKPGDRPRIARDPDPSVDQPEPLSPTEPERELRSKSIGLLCPNLGNGSGALCDPKSGLRNLTYI